MTPEEKIESLETRLGNLEELIFIRILYPDCMHQRSIYCTNTGKEDCRCSKENCPIIDNPMDI